MPTMNQGKGAVSHYIFDERGFAMLQKTRGGSHITADRRFRSTFGCSSLLCSQLWRMIEDNGLMVKGMTPDHILWGLHLMKVYSFQTTNCSFAGGVDEKTFRKWSLIAIQRIADLLPKVVSPFFLNEMYKSIVF